MPRPTARGYALLGLAVAVYVAARVLGTWELYLLAFAFVATFIVSWLLVALTGRRVGVERQITPVRPTAGDEPEMALSVRNGSFLISPRLMLRNRLEGLAHEDLEIEVESMGPKVLRKIQARLAEVNRGVHVLRPTESLAEDPLGVVGARHRVSETLSVTVYPRIVPLESCALYPEMGLRPDRIDQRGLPTPGASEFRGIRPHQPGEPLSHVDWKSTAKTGVLMLRETDEPAGGDITLILDGTAALVVGEVPQTNYELAVSAVGSVADYALRAGRNVNLLLHERVCRQIRLTPDGAGRRALLETLAEAEPSASASLITALGHLHGGGSHLLRAQGVTIVGMSLDRPLVKALSTLRARVVRMTFLYVPGRSFARTTGGLSTIPPFLPPRGEAPELRRGRAAESGADPRFQEYDREQDDVLSGEDRALLLALDSAGVPSITLERDADLVRALGLVRAAQPHGAVGGAERATR